MISYDTLDNLTSKANCDMNKTEKLLFKFEEKKLRDFQKKYKDLEETEEEDKIKKKKKMQ